MKKFTTYSVFAFDEDEEEIYKFQTSEYNEELLKEKLAEAVKLLRPGYTAEYGREDEKYCYAPMTIIEHRKGRPMRHVATLRDGRGVWRELTKHELA